MLLVYLPGLAAMLVYTRNGHSTNDAMISVVLPTISAALMVVIPVSMVRKTAGSVVFDCAWVRWARSELGWFLLLPLAVGISVIPIAVLQYWLGLPLERSVDFEHRFYQIRWLLVWMTMEAVFLGPIAEEFFWRGYVQSTLTQVFHPITAIVIQSVFFGLMHFSAGARHCRHNCHWTDLRRLALASKDACAGDRRPHDCQRRGFLQQMGRLARAG